MSSRIIYGLKGKLEGLLDESPFVNNVHRGQIDDFLRQKENFYPAARVDYGASIVTNETVTVDMTLAVLDQVDDGFGNEDDVLNLCMTIGARVIAQLQEAAHDSQYEVIAEVPGEYIFEYDDANLAGWGFTITVVTPNTSHNA